MAYLELKKLGVIMKCSTALWTLGVLLSIVSSAEGITFREDFDEEFTSTGTEQYRPYGVWVKAFQENDKSWSAAVPGDGYCYIDVHAASRNNDNKYQSIVYNGSHDGNPEGWVGPGHTIEARIKGGYVPGWTGFLFTYGEGEDEIDIELVYQDQYYSDYSPSVRLNTMNGYPPDPGRSLFTGVFDKHNVPPGDPLYEGVPQFISLDDGQFHTYTIEWGYANPEQTEDYVSYWIDGKFQHRHNRPARANNALQKQQVILGFRDMFWIHGPVWYGVQTMVIDYLEITRHDGCDRYPAGDLTEDCKVDLSDLAVLMQEWLVDCFADPGNPACI